MYGKFFASSFTGSMMGAGAEVFAVWGYAIANSDANGLVELNPKLLAAVIGSKPKPIAAAIGKLCTPDPESRSKAEDGRRIVQEGSFIYRIVNHGLYRGIRDEDSRRASQRIAARDKRLKSLGAVGRRRPPSAQVEVVEEEERRSDPEAPLPTTIRLRPGPVTGHELKRVFAAIREREVPGTLSWQTPVSRDGKDSGMAEMLNADPSTLADVIPTMELLFRTAKEGKRGKNSQLILDKPAFGFACWMSDWTALREELRGAASTPKTRMELAQEAEAVAWRNR
jgi:hypothetical protein